MANDTPFGLGASVWTRNAVPEQRRFSAALQCGGSLRQRACGQRSAPALRRRQALRLRPRTLRRRHARVPQREDRGGRRTGRPAALCESTPSFVNPVNADATRVQKRSACLSAEILEEQAQNAPSKSPNADSHEPQRRCTTRGATRLLAAPRSSCETFLVRRRNSLVSVMCRTAFERRRTGRPPSEVVLAERESRTDCLPALRMETLVEQVQGFAVQPTGCICGPCWSRVHHQSRRHRHCCHVRSAASSSAIASTTAAASSAGVHRHPGRSWAAWATHSPEVHPVRHLPAVQPDGPGLRVQPQSSGRNRRSWKAAG